MNYILVQSKFDTALIYSIPTFCINIAFWDWTHGQDTVSNKLMLKGE